MEILTVKQLNEQIAECIKNHFLEIPTITISGEISNLKNSGKNTFLTLKDSSASISCVFWSRNLTDYSNGDSVEITGKVNFYSKGGNINFSCYGIKNIGIGDLHRKYEELYNTYDSKGYFSNRKPLPKNIKKIGIVTAKEGAALQDMLYVLKKNKFCGQIYVYNCFAQGTHCPQTIVNGIAYFNKNINNDNKHYTDSNPDSDSDESNDLFLTNVDIIIVTRGGGSFEDLMGYSDPQVIEAIYNSKIYIISAVGHEVDNMISDYVANYRAPTPSIAAEVICSISESYKQKIIKLDEQLKNKFTNILKDIEILQKHHKTLRNFKQEIINYLNLNEIKIKESVNKNIQIYKKKIEDINSNIELNNPQEILKKGFCIITTESGFILNKIENIEKREKLKLILSDGTYDITVKKCE